MNKSLVFTLLLLTGKAVKTLISVGLALYFLAFDKGGPLAFLLPYAEVILLLLASGSFFLSHKSSRFERALWQEGARQANYCQLKSVEKDAAEWHIKQGEVV